MKVTVLTMSLANRLQTVVIVLVSLGSTLLNLWITADVEKENDGDNLWCHGVIYGWV